MLPPAGHTFEQLHLLRDFAISELFCYRDPAVTRVKSPNNVLLVPFGLNHFCPETFGPNNGFLVALGLNHFRLESFGPNNVFLVPFGFNHFCPQELWPEQHFPRTLWLEQDLWPEQHTGRQGRLIGSFPGVTPKAIKN